MFSWYGDIHNLHIRTCWRHCSSIILYESHTYMYHTHTQSTTLRVHHVISYFPSPFPSYHSWLCGDPVFFQTYGDTTQLFINEHYVRFVMKYSKLLQYVTYQSHFCLRHVTLSAHKHILHIKVIIPHGLQASYWHQFRRWNYECIHELQVSLKILVSLKTILHSNLKNSVDGGVIRNSVHVIV